MSNSPLPPPLIAITDPTGRHREEAAALALELSSAGLSIIADQPQAAEALLSFGPDGLSLQGGREGGTESIVVDFGSDAFIYRLLRGGGRKQPLGRAMGLRPGYSPLVLDATAGLGRDGFLLAALGCKVILCERSPIVHALLRDGLRRAATDPRLDAIVRRLTLHGGDSRDLLPRLPPGERPQVIYLDPMFPHRTKSALVKKEMRLVRAVVGEDPDSSALLQTALTYAASRVVCKRPSQAPTLTGPRPDFAITTPKHRFDIYLTNH